MGADVEVEKLVSNLQDGLERLGKKAAEADTMFSVLLKDGHDTVDLVVQHGHRLSTVVGKLKALIGGQTNSPPVGLHDTEYPTGGQR